jgi:hypothetical protein
VDPAFWLLIARHRIAGYTGEELSAYKDSNSWGFPDEPSSPPTPAHPVLPARMSQRGVSGQHRISRAFMCRMMRKTGASPRRGIA